MNTLIIGYGTVGHNLNQELIKLCPDIYDINHTEYNTKRNIEYDFAFICVDTPLTSDYNLDITQVRNAINNNKSKIYIIKSTCPIGTVEKLKQETSKRIIFSPEYYGGTQHCNNFEFPFTILGGDKKDCIEVIQLLQNCYDARHQFKITDSKTAELVKFMENSWLATKVSFCNQFYDIANNNNISYEELRELFLLDPRVNPAHTFVYKDKTYWDSHCLNKDVPYIAYQQDATFIKNICNYNNNRKIKLSIIIPYYNTYDFTEALLKVLLPQLTQEVEVILVDDGCQETRLDNFDNIKIIHLDKNYGASHAWNVGLSLAKGTYIGFIDSDDMVTENYITVLLDAINKYNTDELIFDFWVKDLKNSHYFLIHRPLCRAIWKAIYKRWLVPQFDESLKYHTDKPFHQHIINTAHTHTHLDVPIYCYSKNRENSITWNYQHKLK